MAVHFLLMVNKQGQTRLAKYCEHGLTTDQKRALEGEIVRKCIRRADKKVGPTIGTGREGTRCGKMG